MDINTLIWEQKGSWRVAGYLLTGLRMEIGGTEAFTTKTF